MNDRPSVRIRFVAVDGTRQEISVPEGWSAVDGAIQYDVEGIMASCGGIGDCATCHVYVHADFQPLLPAIQHLERAALKATATDCLHNSRLACQIEARRKIDGIILYLPERQL